MLDERLRGATTVNLKQLAKEHYTPEYLSAKADMLFSSASQVSGMVERLGLPISHDISEEDKCLVHYCSRNLIRDLWEFTIPRLRAYISENGRFNLEDATRDGLLPKTGNSLEENFDAGQEMIGTFMSRLFWEWVQGLQEKFQKDNNDPLATMFTIYRSHSILISGGDWDAPSIMELTFSSAGRERFEWLRDYQNLSREELQTIFDNSRSISEEPADQLGIKSSSREQVMRYASERGELSFVFNPEERKIVFNPELAQEVASEEEDQRPHYYDKTKLLLQCPARFVASKLYSNGSMLNDLIRFRESVFMELYLAAHNRR